MNKLLLIFAGGGLGSVARYLVGTLTFKLLGPGLPYGTLAVNVIGGFVMGGLVGFLAHRGGADQERWRLLIAVGVLGGFTTFSSVSLETARMIETKQYGMAASYAVGSVVLSIGALFVGLLAARRVFA